MSIAENVADVRAQIAQACARVGRDPQTVTLMAVSKTHPVEAVLAAAAAGVQHFGENRLEEAEQKIPAATSRLEQPLHWHMIGHIQSRKARHIYPLFQMVHSLDSVRLAERLARLAAEAGGALDVLIEINIVGVESKYGFNARRWADDRSVREQLWADMAQMAALDGIRICGLMTMAPIVDNMEAVRPVFGDLRRLRDALSADLKLALPVLSMGMTDDYPVAIEEGSTIVRVGRAIFGQRRE